MAFAVRGSGMTKDSANEFNWGKGDVFVVPSWHTLQLRADRDAVTFSFSDRPVQQALGLWREQRL